MSGNCFLFEIAANDALKALAAVGGRDRGRALAGCGDDAVCVDRTYARVARFPRKPLHAVSVRVLEGDFEVLAEERHGNVRMAERAALRIHIRAGLGAGIELAADDALKLRAADLRTHGRRAAADSGNGAAGGWQPRRFRS